MASVLGHADRVRPFADYCIGLLSTEGRKSVEPLAAVTAPERTAAQHQSLLHFVAQAPWSDQAMLRRVREAVLPSITRDEPIQVWIIDDTGFPEERSPLGRCGAAVLRSGGQAGQLPSGSEPVGSHPSGKPAGCVPAVSTQGVGRRSGSAGNRRRAGEIRFQTKDLRQALADGVAPGVALMDPAYGNDSKLRAGISGLGLTYVAGMMSTTMVWRPSEAPLPAASRSGRGRPGTRLRRDKTHRPVAAKTLALSCLSSCGRAGISFSRYHHRQMAECDSDSLHQVVSIPSDQ